MGWEDYFENKILNRGYAYYKDGYIDSIVKNGNIIDARVSGTRTYRVHIDLDHLDNMKCTCPYFEQAYCKHIAAVLYAIDGDEYEYDNEYEDQYEYEDECAYDNGYQENDIDIQDILDKTSNQQIKDFMYNILKKDSSLLLKFKRFTCTHIDEQDISAYKRNIQNILDNYLGYDNYIDYDEIEDLYGEINDIYEELIPSLMRLKQYSDVFDLTYFLYNQLSYIDIDDSYGYIGLLVDECISIWEEILNQDISQNVKTNMLNVFFKEVDENPFSFDIYKIIFSYFKEKQFLDKKYNFLSKKIKRFENNVDKFQYEYEINIYLSYYMDIICELNNSTVEIEKSCKKYWHFKVIRSKLIDYYIVNQEYEEAIKLLKDSQILDNTNRDYCIEHSHKLIEMYKLINDNEALTDELWKLLTTYRESSIDAYIEYKMLYTGDDLQDKQDTIIYLHNHKLSFLQQVYLEDKQYDLLIKSMMLE